MTHQETLNVSRLPAFNDNYLWIIDNDHQATVIDPGDASVVLSYLSEKKLTLTHIFITHHHPDHIGGVDELISHFNQELTVIGPRSSKIPQVTQYVADNDKFVHYGLPVNVISVPGHTLEHICYLFDKNESGKSLYNTLDTNQITFPLTTPALFCGDTLFAGGCGYLFEGSYEQMLSSLKKLKALPEETLVFCAHEYTESNLKFAIEVEPDNTDLQYRIEQVANLRQMGNPTVPSLLAEELMTNPFLRCNKTSVIERASIKNPELLKDNTEANVFATIREWKNNF